MQQVVQVVNNFNLGGLSFNLSETVEGNDVFSVVIEVPVAQGGVLTTRVDNDDGTLTMTNAGHGILTGDIIDLYWTGGVRRRVVVGTVSGTSVPFGAVTPGSGDNLPVATTAMVACVVVQSSFPATVADINLIAMKSDVECQFHFMEANGTTEDWTKHLTPATDGAEVSASWYATYGAIPITGTTITEVWMSHNDTESAHIMSAAYLND